MSYNPNRFSVLFIWQPDLMVADYLYVKCISYIRIILCDVAYEGNKYVYILLHCV